MYDATTALTGSRQLRCRHGDQDLGCVVGSGRGSICGLMVSPEWIWSPETLAPLTFAFTMAAAP